MIKLSLLILIIVPSLTFSQDKIESCLRQFRQSKEEACKQIKALGFSQEFKDGEDHLILFNSIDRKEMIQLILKDDYVIRIRYLNTSNSEIESFKTKIKANHHREIDHRDDIYYYCPKSKNPEVCDRILVFGNITLESTKYHAVSYGFRN